MNKELEKMKYGGYGDLLISKQNEIENLQQEIERLEEIKKEHSIMKQFIYENGLWEKFLNDDKFIEHLRSE